MEDLNLDLYKILGLTEDKTKYKNNDIKKAYKKLVIIHHPDKGGKVEDFKKLQLAYEILSNEEKRNIYDEKGMRGFQENENEQGFNMNDIFNHMGFNPFNMNGNMEDFFNLRQKKKCKPIHINLDLELKDIYCSNVLNIDYNKDIICNDCNGKGGYNVKKCNDCNGKKMKSQIIRMGPMIMHQQIPCNSCNQTGEQMSNKCKECHGKKILSKQCKLNINISKGCKNIFTQILSNEGDQYPEYDFGDIIINISTKNNKHYIRKENDLYINKEVLFEDILLQKPISIIHLDSKKYNIMFDNYETIQNNHIYKVKNLGMPIIETTNFGNLYININIKLPNLSNDKMIKIYNILTNNELTNDKLNNKLNNELNDELNNNKIDAIYHKKLIITNEMLLNI